MVRYRVVRRKGETFYSPQFKSGLFAKWENIDRAKYQNVSAAAGRCEMMNESIQRAKRDRYPPAVEEVVDVKINVDKGLRARV